MLKHSTISLDKPNNGADITKLPTIAAVDPNALLQYAKDNASTTSTKTTSEASQTADSNSNDNTDSQALYTTIKNDTYNKMTPWASDNEKAEMLKSVPTIWNDVSNKTDKTDKVGNFYNFALDGSDGRTMYYTIDGHVLPNGNKYEQQFPAVLNSLGKNMTPNTFDQAVNNDILRNSKEYADYQQKSQANLATNAAKTAVAAPAAAGAGLGLLPLLLPFIGVPMAIAGALLLPVATGAALLAAPIVGLSALALAPVIIPALVLLPALLALPVLGLGLPLILGAKLAFLPIDLLNTLVLSTVGSIILTAPLTIFNTLVGVGLGLFNTLVGSSPLALLDFVAPILLNFLIVSGISHLVQFTLFNTLAFLTIAKALINGVVDLALALSIIGLPIALIKGLFDLLNLGLGLINAVLLPILLAGVNGLLLLPIALLNTLLMTLFNISIPLVLGFIVSMILSGMITGLTFLALLGAKLLADLVKNGFKLLLGLIVAGVTLVGLPLLVLVAQALNFFILFIANAVGGFALWALLQLAKTLLLGGIAITLFTLPLLGTLAVNTLIKWSIRAIIHIFRFFIGAIKLGARLVLSFVLGLLNLIAGAATAGSAIAALISGIATVLTALIPVVGPVLALLPLLIQLVSIFNNLISLPIKLLTVLNHFLALGFFLLSIPAILFLRPLLGLPITLGAGLLSDLVTGLLSLPLLLFRQLALQGLVTLPLTLLNLFNGFLIEPLLINGLGLLNAIVLPFVLALGAFGLIAILGLLLLALRLPVIALALLAIPSFIPLFNLILTAIFLAPLITLVLSVLNLFIGLPLIFLIDTAINIIVPFLVWLAGMLLLAPVFGPLAFFNPLTWINMPLLAFVGTFLTKLALKLIALPIIFLTNGLLSLLPALIAAFVAGLLHALFNGISLPLLALPLLLPLMLNGLLTALIPGLNLITVPVGLLAGLAGLPILLNLLNKFLGKLIWRSVTFVTVYLLANVLRDLLGLLTLPLLLGLSTPLIFLNKLLFNQFGLFPALWLGLPLLAQLLTSGLLWGITFAKDFARAALDLFNIGATLLTLPLWTILPGINLLRKLAIGFVALVAVPLRVLKGLFDIIRAIVELGSALLIPLAVGFMNFLLLLPVTIFNFLALKLLNLGIPVLLALLLSIGLSLLAAGLTFIVLLAIQLLNGFLKFAARLLILGAITLLILGALPIIIGAAVLNFFLLAGLNAFIGFNIWLLSSLLKDLLTATILLGLFLLPLVGQLVINTLVKWSIRAIIHIFRFFVGALKLGARLVLSFVLGLLNLITGAATAGSIVSAIVSGIATLLTALIPVVGPVLALLPLLITLVSIFNTLVLLPIKLLTGFNHFLALGFFLLSIPAILFVRPLLGLPITLLAGQASDVVMSLLTLPLVIFNQIALLALAGLPVLLLNRFSNLLAAPLLINGVGLLLAFGLPALLALGLLIAPLLLGLLNFNLNHPLLAVLLLGLPGLIPFWNLNHLLLFLIGLHNLISSTLRLLTLPIKVFFDVVGDVVLPLLVYGLNFLLLVPFLGLPALLNPLTWINLGLLSAVGTFLIKLLLALLALPLILIKNLINSIIPGLFGGQLASSLRGLLGGFPIFLGLKLLTLLPIINGLLTALIPGLNLITVPLGLLSLLAQPLLNLGIIGNLFGKGLWRGIGSFGTFTLSNLVKNGLDLIGLPIVLLLATLPLFLLKLANKAFILRPLLLFALPVLPQLLAFNGVVLLNALRRGAELIAELFNLGATLATFPIWGIIPGLNVLRRLAIGLLVLRIVRNVLVQLLKAFLLFVLPVIVAVLLAPLSFVIGLLTFVNLRLFNNWILPLLLTVVPAIFFTVLNQLITFAVLTLLSLLNNLFGSLLKAGLILGLTALFTFVGIPLLVLGMILNIFILLGVNAFIGFNVWLLSSLLKDLLTIGAIIGLALLPLVGQLVINTIVKWSIRAIIHLVRFFIGLFRLGARLVLQFIIGLNNLVLGAARGIALIAGVANLLLAPISLLVPVVGPVLSLLHLVRAGLAFFNRFLLLPLKLISGLINLVTLVGLFLSIPYWLFIRPLTSVLMALGAGLVSDIALTLLTLPLVILNQVLLVTLGGLPLLVLNRISNLFAAPLLINGIGLVSAFAVPFLLLIGAVLLPALLGLGLISLDNPLLGVILLGLPSLIPFWNLNNRLLFFIPALILVKHLLDLLTLPISFIKDLVLNSLLPALALLLIVPLNLFLFGPFNILNWLLNPVLALINTLIVQGLLTNLALPLVLLLNAILGLIPLVVSLLLNALTTFFLGALPLLLGAGLLLLPFGLLQQLLMLNGLLTALIPGLNLITVPLGLLAALINLPVLLALGFIGLNIAVILAVKLLVGFIKAAVVYLLANLILDGLALILIPLTVGILGLINFLPMMIFNQFIGLPVLLGIIVPIIGAFIIKAILWMISFARRAFGILRSLIRIAISLLTSPLWALLPGINLLRRVLFWINIFFLIPATIIKQIFDTLRRLNHILLLQIVPNIIGLLSLLGTLALLPLLFLTRRIIGLVLWVGVALFNFLAPIIVAAILNHILRRILSLGLVIPLLLNGFPMVLVTAGILLFLIKNFIFLTIAKVVTAVVLAGLIILSIITLAIGAVILGFHGLIRLLFLPLRILANILFMPAKLLSLVIFPLNSITIPLFIGAVVRVFVGLVVWPTVYLIQVFTLPLLLAPLVKLLAFLDFLRNNIGNLVFVQLVHALITFIKYIVHTIVDKVITVPLTTFVVAMRTLTLATFLLMAGTIFTFLINPLTIRPAISFLIFKLLNPWTRLFDLIPSLGAYFVWYLGAFYAINNALWPGTGLLFALFNPILLILLEVLTGVAIPLLLPAVIVAVLLTLLVPIFALITPFIFVMPNFFSLLPLHRYLIDPLRLFINFYKNSVLFGLLQLLPTHWILNLLNPINLFMYVFIPVQFLGYELMQVVAFISTLLIPAFRNGIAKLEATIAAVLNVVLVGSPLFLLNILNGQFFWTWLPVLRGLIGGSLIDKLLTIHDVIGLLIVPFINLPVMFFSLINSLFFAATLIGRIFAPIYMLPFKISDIMELAMRFFFPGANIFPGLGITFWFGVFGLVLNQFIFANAVMLPFILYPGRLFRIVWSFNLLNFFLRIQPWFTLNITLELLLQIIDYVLLVLGRKLIWQITYFLIGPMIFFGRIIFAPVASAAMYVIFKGLAPELLLGAALITLLWMANSPVTLLLPLVLPLIALAAQLGLVGFSLLISGALFITQLVVTMLIALIPFAPTLLPLTIFLFLNLGVIILTVIGLFAIGLVRDFNTIATLLLFIPALFNTFEFILAGSPSLFGRIFDNISILLAAVRFIIGYPLNPIMYLFVSPFRMGIYIFNVMLKTLHTVRNWFLLRNLQILLVGPAILLSLRGALGLLGFNTPINTMLILILAIVLEVLFAAAFAIWNLVVGAGQIIGLAALLITLPYLNWIPGILLLVYGTDALFFATRPLEDLMILTIHNLALLQVWFLTSVPMTAFAAFYDILAGMFTIDPITLLFLPIHQIANLIRIVGQIAMLNVNTLVWHSAIIIELVSQVFYIWNRYFSLGILIPGWWRLIPPVFPLLIGILPVSLIPGPLPLMILMNIETVLSVMPMMVWTWIPYMILNILRFVVGAVGFDWVAHNPLFIPLYLLLAPITIFALTAPSYRLHLRLIFRALIIVRLQLTQVFEMLNEEVVRHVLDFNRRLFVINTANLWSLFMNLTTLNLVLNVGIFNLIAIRLAIRIPLTMILDRVLAVLATIATYLALKLPSFLLRNIWIFVPAFTVLFTGITAAVKVVEGLALLATGALIVQTLINGLLKAGLFVLGLIGVKVLAFINALPITIINILAAMILQAILGVFVTVPAFIASIVIPGMFNLATLAVVNLLLPLILFVLFTNFSRHFIELAVIGLSLLLETGYLLLTGGFKIALFLLVLATGLRFISRLAILFNLVMFNIVSFAVGHFYVIKAILFFTLPLYLGIWIALWANLAIINSLLLPIITLLTFVTAIFGTIATLLIVGLVANIASLLLGLFLTLITGLPFTILKLVIANVLALVNGFIAQFIALQFSPGLYLLNVIARQLLFVLPARFIQIAQIISLPAGIFALGINFITVPRFLALVASIVAGIIATLVITQVLIFLVPLFWVPIIKAIAFADFLANNISNVVFARFLHAIITLVKWALKSILDDWITVPLTTFIVAMSVLTASAFFLLQAVVFTFLVNPLTILPAISWLLFRLLNPWTMLLDLFPSITAYFFWYLGAMYVINNALWPGFGLLLTILLPVWLSIMNATVALTIPILFPATLVTEALILLVPILAVAMPIYGLIPNFLSIFPIGRYLLNPLKLAVNFYRNSLILGLLNILPSHVLLNLLNPINLFMYVFIPLQFLTNTIVQIIAHKAFKFIPQFRDGITMLEANIEALFRMTILNAPIFLLNILNGQFFWTWLPVLRGLLGGSVIDKLLIPLDIIGMIVVPFISLPTMFVSLIGSLFFAGLLIGRMFAPIWMLPFKFNDVMELGMRFFFPGANVFPGLGLVWWFGVLGLGINQFVLANSMMLPFLIFPGRLFRMVWSFNLLNFFLRIQPWLAINTLNFVVVELFNFLLSAIGRKIIWSRVQYWMLLPGVFFGRIMFAPIAAAAMYLVFSALAPRLLLLAAVVTSMFMAYSPVTLLMGLALPLITVNNIILLNLVGLTVTAALGIAALNSALLIALMPLILQPGFLFVMAAISIFIGLVLLALPFAIDRLFNLISLSAIVAVFAVMRTVLWLAHRVVSGLLFYGLGAIAVLFNGIMALVYTFALPLSINRLLGWLHVARLVAVVLAQLIHLLNALIIPVLTLPLLIYNDLVFFAASLANLNVLGLLLVLLIQGLEIFVAFPVAILAELLFMLLGYFPLAGLLSLGLLLIPLPAFLITNGVNLLLNFVLKLINLAVNGFLFIASLVLFIPAAFNTFEFFLAGNPRIFGRIFDNISLGLAAVRFVIGYILNPIMYLLVAPVRMGIYIFNTMLKTLHTVRNWFQGRLLEILIMAPSIVLSLRGALGVLNFNTPINTMLILILAVALEILNAAAFAIWNLVVGAGQIIGLAAVLITLPYLNWLPGINLLVYGTDALFFATRPIEDLIILTIHNLALIQVWFLTGVPLTAMAAFYDILGGLFTLDPITLLFLPIHQLINLPRIIGQITMLNVNTLVWHSAIIIELVSQVFYIWNRYFSLGIIIPGWWRLIPPVFPLLIGILPVSLIPGPLPLMILMNIETVLSVMPMSVWTWIPYLTLTVIRLVLGAFGFDWVAANPIFIPIYLLLAPITLFALTAPSYRLHLRLVFRALIILRLQLTQVFEMLNEEVFRHILDFNRRLFVINTANLWSLHMNLRVLPLVLNIGIFQLMTIRLAIGIPFVLGAMALAWLVTFVIATGMFLLPALLFKNILQDLTSLTNPLLAIAGVLAVLAGITYTVVKTAWVLWTGFNLLNHFIVRPILNLINIVAISALTLIPRLLAAVFFGIVVSTAPIWLPLLIKFNTIVLIPTIANLNAIPFFLIDSLRILGDINRLIFKLFVSFILLGGFPGIIRFATDIVSALVFGLSLLRNLGALNSLLLLPLKVLNDAILNNIIPLLLLLPQLLINFFAFNPLNPINFLFFPMMSIALSLLNAVLLPLVLVPLQILLNKVLSLIPALLAALKGPLSRLNAILKALLLPVLNIASLIGLFIPGVRLLALPMLLFTQLAALPVLLNLIRNLARPLTLGNLVGLASYIIGRLITNGLAATLLLPIPALSFLPLFIFNLLLTNLLAPLFGGIVLPVLGRHLISAGLWAINIVKDVLGLVRNLVGNGLLLLTMPIWTILPALNLIRRLALLGDLFIVTPFKLFNKVLKRIIKFVGSLALGIIPLGLVLFLPLFIAGLPLLPLKLLNGFLLLPLMLLANALLTLPVSLILGNLIPLGLSRVAGLLKLLPDLLGLIGQSLLRIASKIITLLNPILWPLLPVLLPLWKLSKSIQGFKFADVLKDILGPLSKLPLDLISGLFIPGPGLISTPISLLKVLKDVLGLGLPILTTLLLLPIVHIGLNVLGMLGLPLLTNILTLPLALINLGIAKLALLPLKLLLRFNNGVILPAILAPITALLSAGLIPFLGLLIGIPAMLLDGLRLLIDIGALVLLSLPGLIPFRNLILDLILAAPLLINGLSLLNLLRTPFKLIFDLLSMIGLPFAAFMLFLLPIKLLIDAITLPLVLLSGAFLAPINALILGNLIPLGLSHVAGLLRLLPDLLGMFGLPLLRIASKVITLLNPILWPLLPLLIPAWILSRKIHGFKFADVLKDLLGPLFKLPIDLLSGLFIPGPGLIGTPISLIKVFNDLIRGALFIPIALINSLLLLPITNLVGLVGAPLITPLISGLLTAPLLLLLPAFAGVDVVLIPLHLITTFLRVLNNLVKHVLAVITLPLWLGLPALNVLRRILIAALLPIVLVNGLVNIVKFIARAGLLLISALVVLGFTLLLPIILARLPLLPLKLLFGLLALPLILFNGLLVALPLSLLGGLLTPIIINRLIRHLVKLPFDLLKSVGLNLFNLLLPFIPGLNLFTPLLWGLGLLLKPLQLVNIARDLFGSLPVDLLNGLLLPLGQIGSFVALLTPGLGLLLAPVLLPLRLFNRLVAIPLTIIRTIGDIARILLLGLPLAILSSLLLFPIINLLNVGLGIVFLPIISGLLTAPLVLLNLLGLLIPLNFITGAVPFLLANGMSAFNAYLLPLIVGALMLPILGIINLNRLIKDIVKTIGKLLLNGLALLPSLIPFRNFNLRLLFLIPLLINLLSLFNIIKLPFKFLKDLIVNGLPGLLVGAGLGLLLLPVFGPLQFLNPLNWINIPLISILGTVLFKLNALIGNFILNKITSLVPAVLASLLSSLFGGVPVDLLGLLGLGLLNLGSLVGLLIPGVRLVALPLLLLSQLLSLPFLLKTLKDVLPGLLRSTLAGLVTFATINTILNLLSLIPLVLFNGLITLPVFGLKLFNNIFVKAPLLFLGLPLLAQVVTFVILKALQLLRNLPILISMLILLPVITALSLFNSLPLGMKIILPALALLVTLPVKLLLDLALLPIMLIGNALLTLPLAALLGNLIALGVSHITGLVRLLPDIIGKLGLPLLRIISKVITLLNPILWPLLPILIPLWQASGLLQLFKTADVLKDIFPLASFPVDLLNAVAIPGLGLLTLLSMLNPIFWPLLPVLLPLALTIGIVGIPVSLLNIIKDFGKLLLPALLTLLLLPIIHTGLNILGLLALPLVSGVLTLPLFLLNLIVPTLITLPVAKSILPLLLNLGSAILLSSFPAILLIPFILLGNLIKGLRLLGDILPLLLFLPGALKVLLNLVILPLKILINPLLVLGLPILAKVVTFLALTPLMLLNNFLAPLLALPLLPVLLLGNTLLPILLPQTLLNLLVRPLLGLTGIVLNKLVFPLLPFLLGAILAVPLLGLLAIPLPLAVPALPIFLISLPFLLFNQLLQLLSLGMLLLGPALILAGIIAAPFSLLGPIGVSPLASSVPANSVGDQVPELGLHNAAIPSVGFWVHNDPLILSDPLK
ncbi:hypothetical protein [Companilactobacillus mishanensis]|uniref:hypothetical protein n=1 Tax=Companilactobacillus mishanensis TaxID=2486008 RepID=UPI001294D4A2|nr:hypothetical protein [Companilactobacillus mishanensis]MQS90340.1 hypothetical protein [Companilactobacillus mishanensis]